MILVTGAAGKTGTAVIRALLDRDKEVRALVRLGEQVEELSRLGVSEVIDGDLADRGVVRRAVAGAEAMYHIPPNVDPRELDYAALLIKEAITADVKHFGYHSVMHPQTQRMVHHWKKLRVEEALFECGLPFTIIQPCAYMQNLLAHRETILVRGVIEVPYSIEASLSLVDLEDVAAAVATILTEPGHLWAIYELAGPEALNHMQVAAIYGSVLGRPVSAKRISVDEWATAAQNAGLGEYQLEALLAMFAYYDRFGFKGNPNVLAQLIGRQPSTFEEFVKRMN